MIVAVGHNTMLTGTKITPDQLDEERLETVIKMFESWPSIDMLYGYKNGPDLHNLYFKEDFVIQEE
jgi:hypothetical protein